MATSSTNRCLVCGKKIPADRKVCSITCRQRYNGSQSNKNRDYGTRICIQCKKEFTAQALHQKSCSERCQRIASYYRNIEARRERDRKRKIPKQRIGLNIRDAHLQTPSKHAKWLWDGIGRWSVKYWPDIQECLECGTNVYRHDSNGVCEYCTNKNRQLSPETRAKIDAAKRRHYERKHAEGMTSAQQARDWIQKAKGKKIPITPKIGNLLENLEKIENE